MREHFNLYYLFMEDKLKKPMPEEQRMIMRKKLQKFFQKNKTDYKFATPYIVKGGQRMYERTF